MLQDYHIARVGRLGRLVDDFDLGLFIDGDGLQRLLVEVFWHKRLQVSGYLPLWSAV